jgi:hypothetical protein
MVMVLSATIAATALIRTGQTLLVILPPPGEAARRQDQFREHQAKTGGFTQMRQAIAFRAM